MKKEEMIKYFNDELYKVELEYKTICDRRVKLQNEINIIDDNKKFFEDNVYRLKTALSCLGVIK